MSYLNKKSGQNVLGQIGFLVLRDEGDTMAALLAMVGVLSVYVPVGAVRRCLAIAEFRALILLRSTSVCSIFQIMTKTTC